MAKIRVIIRKFHAKYDNGVSDPLSWKTCEQYCQLHELCYENHGPNFYDLCPDGPKYISDFTILEVRND